MLRATIRSLSLLKKLNYNRIHCTTSKLSFSSKISSASQQQQFNAAVEAPDDDENNNQPIRYSTSSANKWKASMSLHGAAEPRLWYEPIVVLVSLAAFMIYFTVLREENDIDEELGRSLYSRIDGLEEMQLNLSLDFNKSRGLPTGDIVKRLIEIEGEKRDA